MLGCPKCRSTVQRALLSKGLSRSAGVTRSSTASTVVLYISEEVSTAGDGAKRPRAPHDQLYSFCSVPIQIPFQRSRIGSRIALQ